LFKRGIVKVDVVLIQVSPPDEHGFCSLGVSVEGTVAAIESAKYVVAQINKYMPRTFGDSILHISKIDLAVEYHCPIYASEVLQISEKEEIIGKYVANLIEDESTLQMGIGSIPNAVLEQLTSHKNLGLHTEMFSDGVIDLIESGVINCSQKTVTKGRALATFLIGSERLYKFVNNNPFIVLKESSYVNDTAVIRQNPKVVAINSALEVDLTGQVCADSIGVKMYSGVGGQMDFVRGASLSKGGKAIIALASTSNKGHNRIVPFLRQGAGVVTTRAHAQYIVTEYGIADLYGKTLKQRVEAMVEIAHPDFREEILSAYHASIR
jgi:acyl-CoA hydrolase